VFSEAAMRVIVNCISQKNSSPDKPFEDAYAISDDSRAFCIADGVTRSRLECGAYPNPSPASIAAELVTTTMVASLSKAQAGSVTDGFSLLERAMASANASVRKYASTLPPVDYWGYDLPGAVSTAVVLTDAGAAYAHIGDTALFHLAGETQLTRVTTDHTLPLERWAEEHQYLSRQRRLMVARTLFRNNNKATPSYGVLTGESEALGFVEYGSLSPNSGDFLLLMSDGMGPLFLACGHNKELLRRTAGAIRKHKLEEVMALSEEVCQGIGGSRDDRTLISMEVLE
jgi:serine/threonine protein phosphatase PrpC